MKQKKGLSIVEQAIISVPGFEQVFKKLEQQVVLRGQSVSTLRNYIRRIALISIHFQRLPEAVEEEEINEYLVALARDPRSPSRSSFKHMVYGLRYYYRLLGLNPLSADGFFTNIYNKSSYLLFVSKKINNTILFILYL